MTYTGFVIRCSQYKDYDAMINLLTKDGLISFYARNVFKYDHKNSVLSSILIYGNFTFSDNKDKFLLFKEVETIFDSREYLNDIKILSFLNLINELILKVVDENDLTYIYDDLLFILNNIKTLNLNLVITYFIAKTLKISGYGLDTSSYDIDSNISYDFINGKFINVNCYSSLKNRRYSKEEKEILHDAFTFDINKIVKLNFKIENIKLVNTDLFNYIQSSFGIVLKSTKMIEKVL